MFNFMNIKKSVSIPVIVRNNATIWLKYCEFDHVFTENVDDNSSKIFLYDCHQVYDFNLNYHDLIYEIYSSYHIFVESNFSKVFITIIIISTLILLISTYLLYLFMKS